MPSPASPRGDEPWRRDGVAAANDDRFRHMVEESPTITWATDGQGNLTYVNPRLAEYTGIEPPPRMADWAAASICPEDLPRRAAAWEKAVASGTPYEVELRIRGRNGHYRWFLAHATPVKDDNGRVIEWLGTATDIDERKRSTDNLRFLAEAGTALAEVTGIEETLNRIAQLAVPYFSDWCEVTFKDPSDGVKRLAAIHTDPEQLRLLKELDERFERSESSGAAWVLKTGQPQWVAVLDEATLREAASSPDHLEMLRRLNLRSFMAVPIPSKEGVLGVLSFATAESGRIYGPLDLKVAEELARRAGVALENARLMQALRDADRRKDEFLAVLAHELRNPLAPVRNAVEILRTMPSPSPQLQWTHDVIDRQVRQMSRLVDDLLDVSRIARGKITLKAERVDLADAIRLALETSRPLIERGGHEFTLRLKPERLLVEGDLSRIAQVVANLLNNAARYTPPGGHIWLSAGRSGSNVEIRVGDNGIGIEPHMLSHIFEMFAQAGSEGDRSQGGLGIGLTLVKRLVEMHGGSVEATSPGPGRGSEFIVRLPLSGEELAGTAPGATANAKVPEQRWLRVLVVDDNRDAADSLSMLLAGRGHEVRVAYDGLEAVGAAIAFDPDVVLMDIGLPKLYGYEAAKRIRQARGDAVMLVAVTGWGQEEDRRRAREAGFDFHLTKPVDLDAISRLIDEAGRKT